MKITIDITEIEALSEAQSELDKIDRELSELVQAIAQGSQAPQGKPFAVQLQQLLSKAVNTVKNAPPDDTQLYLDRYTEAVVTDAVIQWMRPHQQELTNRLRTLQAKVTRAAPSSPSQIIVYRNELYKRIGDTATLQLADSITEQVQAQLNEQLADKVTG